MTLIERAKAVCLSPDSEWTTIAGEHTEAAALITGYVLPLAGLAAAAQLIGGTLIGRSFGIIGTFRVPITTGIGIAIASLAFAAVGVVVMSFVIDGLAPTFGAQKSREQALKVAVYSATPVWIAGVVQIIPALGILVLLGALYALYLLYLGLPRLMKCPAEKTVAYLGAVIACAIVVGLIGSTIIASIGAVNVAAAVAQ